MLCRRFSLWDSIAYFIFLFLLFFMLYLKESLLRPVTKILPLYFLQGVLGCQVLGLKLWVNFCKLCELLEIQFFCMYLSSIPNNLCWKDYPVLIECSWLPCQLFNSVQVLSRVWFFVTPWTAMHQASLSITNSQSLPKLMSIELVMPPNHLILCRPLLLLPSILPNSRVFSNESALCIRWPKYWSVSFNISPSNEHSGQISFRMDWLDLLVIQGTSKSLLQHHSSKASILWHSAFFIVQLSHPYMSTGKKYSLD